jgi:hypothetical protein
MAVSHTVHGASGGHGLETLLGQRLDESGGATTCAGVEHCQVQGHDGPLDVFRGVRRVALGSLRSFLSPGGLGYIVALAPRVAPALRAGQVPADVLDLGCGTSVVESLAPTWCMVLRHQGCLGELRVPVPMEHVFSRVWHTGWRLRGAVWTWRMPSLGTRHA